MVWFEDFFGKQDVSLGVKKDFLTWMYMSENTCTDSMSLRWLSARIPRYFDSMLAGTLSVCIANGQSLPDQFSYWCLVGNGGMIHRNP